VQESRQFQALWLLAGVLCGCPTDTTSAAAFAQADAGGFADTISEVAAQPDAGTAVDAADGPPQTEAASLDSADALPPADASLCPPPTPCADTNPCTDDLCDPQAGCVYVPNQATCTDGDACTTGDRCTALACTATATTECGDGNPCTDDLCDKLKGCVSNPAAATLCSDGNACTEGDFCGSGACQPGAKKACDDGNPCTVDSCDSIAGCLAIAATGTCDDGLACTVADACVGAKCQGKPALFTLDIGLPSQIEVAYRTLPDPQGYRVLVRAPYQPGLGFGKDDVWLHRIDLTGQLLGKTTFGTAGSDSPFDAEVLPDGGLLVAGQADFGGLNVLDALLVRVDAQGKAVWTQTYGSEPTTEAAYGMALAGDKVTLVGTVTALPSGKDTWIARTDLSGKLLWTVAFDYGPDEAARAAQPVAGGIVAAGWNTMDQGLWQAGFVARYGDAGTELWHTTVGKKGAQSRFHALAKLPDGDFVAVGDQRAGGRSSTTTGSRA
jgi:hypothetical protein